MICYNCGRELLDDEIFCVNCGAPMQQMPMQQMPMQQMPMQQMPVQEMPVQEITVQKTPVKETHVEEKVIYVEEKTITKEVNMNQTSLWWLTPLALFAILFIWEIIDELIGIKMSIDGRMFFTVAFAVSGLICLAKFEDDDKRRIVSLFRIVGAVAIVSIFVYGMIASKYAFRDNRNIVHDISNVSEEELENGTYLQGTIHKVMSKVGVFNGRTYYTVMLPSTDMTDWDAYDKNIVEQGIEVSNGEIPMTDVGPGERRVLVISTNDVEEIKLLDEMLDDNKHYILSKYTGTLEKYKGKFVVKELSDEEIISAFENSAIGLDNTFFGIGYPSIEKENLCYYELEPMSYIPERKLDLERSNSRGILIAVGVYILWKIIYCSIDYIKRQVAAKNT